MAKGLTNNQTGFTIIELVVTLAALGIFVAAVGSLFSSITAAQHSTDLMAIATHAGETEIETLRNNNYNTLTAGTTIDFSSQLPSNLPKGSTGVVVVTSPETDLRRVDVTVTYPVGSTSHNVELSSLIGRIGIGK